MELVREEGKVILRWPRGRAAIYALSAVGLFFFVVGTAALLTGQHLPGISSLATVAWAYLVAIPSICGGLSFIGYRQELTFSAYGLDAYFSRYRFIEWRLQYPVKRIEAIFIEPHRYAEVSRLLLQIKGQNDLEITRNLPNEEAWSLASILSEVTALPIRGA